jgi:hypothetical protein
VADEVGDGGLAVERHPADRAADEGGDLADEGTLARAAGAVEEGPLVVLEGLGDVAGGVGPDEGGVGLGDQGVVHAVAGGHGAAGDLELIVQDVVELADAALAQEAGEGRR